MADAPEPTPEASNLIENKLYDRFLREGQTYLAFVNALDRFAAQRAALAVEQMRARKDTAYTERNRVVAALAKLFPSGTKQTDIPGWSEDWHGCVYIDLPTGQVSWHYHDGQAPLFADLPPYRGEWDGHTTELKYERLATLAAIPPSGDAGERAREIVDAAYLAAKGAAESRGAEHGWTDATRKSVELSLRYDELVHRFAAALQSERTAAASEARRTALLAAFKTTLPKADEAWSREALDVMNTIRGRISNLAPTSAALPVMEEPT